MAQMRWLRILGAGFLSECAVFLVFIPATVLLGTTPGMYAAVIGSLIMPLAFGMWAARTAAAHRILHGTLVGAIGIVIYLGLTRAQPEPLLYIFAHVLKLVGGAAGGYVASRQSARTVLVAAGETSGVRPVEVPLRKAGKSS
jgi:hypothetical protein